MHKSADSLRHVVDVAFGVQAPSLITVLNNEPLSACVIIDGERLFVKRMPWYLSAHEFGSALSCQETLSIAGAPCEELIRNRHAGLTTTTLAGVFRFSRWIGEASGATRVGPLLSMSTLGKTLGQLHVAARRVAKFVKPGYLGSAMRFRSFPDGAAAMRIFSEKLSAATRVNHNGHHEGLETQLLQSGALLEQASNKAKVFTICHGDVSALNAIDDGRGCRFVDFDDARWMPQAYELAWALLSAGMLENSIGTNEFTLRRSLDCGAMSVFLEGYLRNCPLPDTEALRLYLLGLQWPVIENSLERRKFMNDAEMLADLLNFVSNSAPRLKEFARLWSN